MRVNTFWKPENLRRFIRSLYFLLLLFLRYGCCVLISDHKLATIERRLSQDRSRRHKNYVINSGALRPVHVLRRISSCTQERTITFSWLYSFYYFVSFLLNITSSTLLPMSKEFVIFHRLKPTSNANLRESS